MKEIVIKRCAIYLIGLIILIVVNSLLNEIIADTPFGSIIGIILMLAICAMLVDIGRLIKDKLKRKKYIICVIIFVGQIAIIQLISIITGVGTENTWLGVIGISVVFLTATVMMFRVAKSIKRTHVLFAYLLYFAIFLIVTGVVINNIAFFTGAF